MQQAIGLVVLLDVKFDKYEPLADVHILYLQEALKNILIVFAKLNPGIRYVQGMNEILAPLFYVFRNDPMEENAVRNGASCLVFLSMNYCL